MSLFNIIPVLAGKREKETVQLMKEHANITYTVVFEFKNAFSAFKTNDYEAMEKKIDEVCCLESKADGVRRKIEENMYSGAFFPGSRSIILNFTEMVDEIANSAQDAARMLILLKDRKVPDEILSLICSAVNDGLDTINTLRASITDLGAVEDIKSAIEHIRKKEHESDEAAHEAYVLIYKNISDAIVVVLISKLVEFVGDISDRAEDATDALSLILLLHKI